MNIKTYEKEGDYFSMARELKHIKTILKSQLQKTMEIGGCGECQVSCQSACKTSCTVGNQICEKTDRKLG